MLKRKKVLQVSPAYFPAISIGGPIFTNLTFSQALVDIGYDIEVLTTTQGLKKEQIQRFNIGKVSHDEFPYPIWRFHYYGYPNYTFAPGLLFWLFQHVKKFDLVVFQAVWNFPIMAAYWACKYYNIPYVIIPHGSLYDETFHLKSSKVKKLFLKIYVENMLKRARKIIFSTRDEEIKVKKFLSLPITSAILPNIVNTDQFKTLPIKGNFRTKYSINLEAIILCHYGRVTVKKGINFVIQILPSLIKKYPHIKYVIAGGEEDNYISELKNMINHLQLEDHVIFAGLLNPQEGMELLVDSQVFLLPSLSENFGMSVVEAMLCETPVIISEQVGIALELVESNAAYIIQLGNDSLENAVLELLGNPDIQVNMGKAGRKFVQEHYEFDAVKNQLKEIISGSML